MSLFNDVIKAHLKLPIVLLGAGQLAEMAIKMWPIDKLDLPVAVVDRNPLGDEFFGIECVATENHKATNDFVYVLAFFKERPTVIIEKFKSLGQPIITVYDIFEIFASEIFSNGWHEYISDQEQRSLLRCFAGSPNCQKIITDVISWRSRRVLSADYPMFEESKKYELLSEISCSFSGFDIIVDGGSFDCSFMKMVNMVGLEYGKALVVEPDISSFEQTKIVTRHNLMPRVKCYNLALSGDAGTAYLINNGLLSARIVETSSPVLGSVRVSCITLSELIEQSIESLSQAPFLKILIKLHVEGAETEVIKECATFLSKFDTVLMFINISHSKDALFDVPRTLWEAGFKLRLHNHALFGEGVTLVAKK